MGVKMARQRYINTRFWDDSYIVELLLPEKFLFIYLLTNPLTNIIGIYEISLKRISFDIGVPAKDVKLILEKFSKDEKILYKNGFIAIKNFIKHQKLNPSIIKGIKALQTQVPEELFNWVSTACIEPV